MESLMPIEDIALRIGAREIPLPSRIGTIMRLLAMHQAVINTGTVKLVLDCSPAEIALSITTRVGKQKVRR